MVSKYPANDEERQKVRICIDHRDLNKACPKDDFPLPHIDVLFDNAGTCAMYSFMDGLFWIQLDFNGHHRQSKDILHHRMGYFLLLSNVI